MAQYDGKITNFAVSKNDTLRVTQNLVLIKTDNADGRMGISRKFVHKFAPTKISVGINDIGEYRIIKGKGNDEKVETLLGDKVIELLAKTYKIAPTIEQIFWNQ